MTSSHEFAANPRQYAEQVLQDSQEALTAAVTAVLPEQPDADPLQVFPPTGEVRNTDFGDPDFITKLSQEQVSELRSAIGRLGFERSTDLSAASIGLRGAHVIIEGGQPHKMVAETRLIVDDEAAAPSTLIFAATKYRKLENEAERASARRQFGEVPENEYAAARKVAEALPGFEPSDKDEVLAVGYDIDNGFALVRKATGQFVRIGKVGNVPLIMMSIDRQVDSEDGKKYSKQPGTTEVIQIVDAVSASQGDQLLPIAFVTSGTYQPSRSVAAAKVALRTGRVVGVPSYGTDRLKEVNGSLPEPRRLDQLPGEINKLAKEVEKLRIELAPKASAIEERFNLEPLGDNLEARLERSEALLSLALDLILRKTTNQPTKLSELQNTEAVFNGYRSADNQVDVFDDINPEY